MELSGLLTKNPILRRKKIDKLISFCRNRSFVLLQEVHGSGSLLRLSIGPLAASFWIFDSIPCRSSGGVAILVRKSVCPDPSLISCDVLAPGRILRLSVTLSSSTLFLYNVHNHDISKDTFTSFSNFVGEDFAVVDEDPAEHLALLFGDWNFLQAGDTKCELSDPSPSEFYSAARLSQSDAQPCVLSTRWTRLLDRCVELDQPCHTHYNKSSRSTSRLDRAYIYTPSWSICHTRLSACLLAEPQHLHEARISDHAPVVITFKSAPPRNNADLPISKAVFDLSSFDEIF